MRLFSPPTHLTVDREAAIGGEHARRTGRSWWALRYLDGRIVHEWDPDPGSPNGHQDWTRLAMLGRLKRTQALRLYCPNGRMAHVELPGGGDATGRLIQFKRAVRHIALSLGNVTQIGDREVLGHVIGVVTGLDGQCVLCAWEPLPPPEPPPGMPQEPKKPNYHNKEQPLWALKEQHERYMSECDAYDRYRFGEPVRLWKRAIAEWESNARGRLVEPFEDNVYNIKYDHIGRLSADHLGMSDGEGR